MYLHIFEVEIIDTLFLACKLLGLLSLLKFIPRMKFGIICLFIA